MKMTLLLSIGLLISQPLFAQNDPSILIGNWKLDMSPHNVDDDNFAIMVITNVSDNQMKGTFYRKGVKFKNSNPYTFIGSPNSI